MLVKLNDSRVPELACPAVLMPVLTAPLLLPALRRARPPDVSLGVLKPNPLGGLPPPVELVDNGSGSPVTLLPFQWKPLSVLYTAPGMSCAKVEGALRLPL